MIRIICFFVFISLFGLGTSPIQAQNLLTLHEAIVRAIQHNPALEGSRSDVKMAALGVQQARLNPNPQLSLSAKQPDFETSFLLEQTIDLWGKQSIEIRRATRLHDIAILNYHEKQLEMATKVSRAFLDTWALQEQQEVMISFLKMEETYFRQISEKVLAGTASEQDKKRAGVQVSLQRLLLQKTINQVKIKKRALSQLWGEIDPSFDLISGDFYSLPTPLSLEKYRSRLPENLTLKIAEKSIDLAQSSTDAVKSNPWSPVTFGAGLHYKQDNGQTAGILSLFVPVPLSDQNQWKIEQASQGIKKALSEKQTLSLAVLQELEMSESQLQIAYREAHTLKTDMLPTLDSIRKNALEGYLQGKWPYIEVIEAHKANLNTELTYIEVVKQYHQALAHICELTNDFNDALKGEFHDIQ